MKGVNVVEDMDYYRDKLLQQYKCNSGIYEFSLDIKFRRKQFLYLVHENEEEKQ